jgi:hypothetical protein
LTAFQLTTIILYMHIHASRKCAPLQRALFVAYGYWVSQNSLPNIDNQDGNLTGPRSMGLDVATDAGTRATARRSLWPRNWARL